MEAPVASGLRAIQPLLFPPRVRTHISSLPSHRAPCSMLRSSPVVPCCSPNTPDHTCSRLRDCTLSSLSLPSSFLGQDWMPSFPRGLTESYLLKVASAVSFCIKPHPTASSASSFLSVCPHRMCAVCGQLHEVLGPRMFNKSHSASNSFCNLYNLREDSLNESNMYTTVSFQNMLSCFGRIRNFIYLYCFCILPLEDT